MIFSALPTASSCYVLAARMGYDGAYVAGLVTLSTLLGMLSLPLALGLFKHLFYTHFGFIERHFEDNWPLAPDIEI